MSFFFFLSVNWKRVIAENTISPATKELISLALHKLTTDGQEQTLSMLQVNFQTFGIVEYYVLAAVRQVMFVLLLNF